MLAAALAIGLWLSLARGESVERLSSEDAVRQPCDAAAIQNFDAVAVITDDVDKVVRTYTVSGSDSRVLYEGYTLDGDVLFGRLEEIYEDGVWYQRASSEDNPNIWEPWEVLDVDANAAIPGTPCLAAQTSSTERYFTWEEPGFRGRTTNTNEVWVNSSGLPTRGVITETESIASGVAGGASDSASTPSVLQRTEITYSGFGEANTITAPITFSIVAPKFVSEEYTFSIAEDAAPGTIVGTVSAAGGTGGLEYTFSYGNWDNLDGHFRVDSGTGVIKVAAGLDYETKGFYSLDVTVTDVTDETDKVTVNITITDVDES